MWIVFQKNHKEFIKTHKLILKSQKNIRRTKNNVSPEDVKKIALSAKMTKE